MFDGVQFWQVLIGIFAVSVIMTVRSMRELKAPQDFYPKIEKRMRGLLSGFIDLPKAS